MIVRVSAKLDVMFGRIDADGDIVNETVVSFPLGKVCDAEWQRIFGEVQAKQTEIQAAVDGFHREQKQAEIDQKLARLAELEAQQAPEAIPDAAE